MTLLEHVAKTDGCWMWTGAVARDGYGKAQGTSAHRAVYEATFGPVADGLDLDHLCRNRLCVNPDHLEPVTRAENQRRAALHWASTNATHCKNGHEFTPENTYMRPRSRGGGVRQCRTCNRTAAIRYKSRKKALA